MARIFVLFLIPLFVATLAQAQVSVPTQSALTPAPVASPSLENEGHATFVRVCSTCHAPEIVAHQRLDREGWTTIVYQMANQGAVATDAELDEIIDYLSRSYPDEEQPAA